MKYPFKYVRVSYKTRTSLSMMGLLLILALGAMPSEALATGSREAQIKRCQIIKNNIEYYTGMRRGGGSSSQMRSWQSQRNKYKQRYRDENCTRVRSALK